MYHEAAEKVTELRFAKIDATAETGDLPPLPPPHTHTYQPALSKGRGRRWHREFGGRVEKRELKTDEGNDGTVAGGSRSAQHFNLPDAAAC